MVQIKLYEWKDISASKILDTTTLSITNYQLPELLSGYTTPIMDLNAERNQLIMTFVGIGVSNKYIVNVIYNLSSKRNAVDIIYIAHDIPLLTGTTREDEPRNIIDINFFDNKLLFVVEGSATNTKYLQIVDIDEAEEI
jgi:hypothetical protein